MRITFSELRPDKKKLKNQAKCCFAKTCLLEEFEQNQKNLKKTGSMLNREFEITRRLTWKLGNTLSDKQRNLQKQKSGIFPQV